MQCNSYPIVRASPSLYGYIYVFLQALLTLYIRMCINNPHAGSNPCSPSFYPSDIYQSLPFLHADSTAVTRLGGRIACIFPPFFFFFCFLQRPGNNNGFMNCCQSPSPSLLSRSIDVRGQHISPKPDPSVNTV